jgi:hypothetical protein
MLDETPEDSVVDRSQSAVAVDADQSLAHGTDGASKGPFGVGGLALLRAEEG